MIVEQTSHFKKAFKKLHANQRKCVEVAIGRIMESPFSDEMKKGDLAGMRVYKFPMLKQLTLLAYTYEEERLVLRLLMFGSHENFYRDLKQVH